LDPVPARRSVAMSFGATEVLASLDEVDAGGYDVVAECAGKATLLNGASAPPASGAGS
jgi:hypothetical protein